MSPSRASAPAILAAWACLGCSGPETDPSEQSPGTVTTCESSEIELADGSCVLPGVPPSECGTGFEPDGVSGCAPILPPDVCPDGMMAIVGETLCREVAPCGDAPWGAIPVEPDTVYVDGSYGGGDSDGSAERPWVGVQEAIDAATPGAIVAVAAGTYLEDLILQDKSVRLWGRCPTMVQLAGTGAMSQTVLILDGAAQTEVHRVSVTGPGLGFAVSGSENVELTELRIHDTGASGLETVDVVGPTGVTLRGSLIERATQAGIHVAGATLAVEGTAIRDTAVPADDDSGYGIACPDGDQGPSQLTVRQSVIERNTGVGINIVASSATIEETVVRDSLPTADGTFGR
ncbi:MAG: right-handed parallel beta-helix repeat-containing protein, partial [Deltaproteobacteria bacterium]|nr:right-handed parallel beta-helix repeat-containing protein [Deltaproteobacteria bacterium]